MRKTLFVVLAALAALALGGLAAAQTGGAHFTKGGTPVCTDIGTQLRCTAEVAGLGNETVVSTVSANGTATGLTCTTPSGSNQAPGQNPAVPVTAGGSPTVQNPKKGRGRVHVAPGNPAG